MERTRGFTIIETLVAITILIVAIAGPLVIASKGLSASIYARDQITAFYLAQEAVEFIRNERDSSGLRARFAAPTFVERFAECASGPCTVDIRAAEVESCDGGECPPLLFDEASGLYSYVSGDPSPFTRSVELEEVNDREIALTVTMDWTSGLLNRSFSIHGRLLEWFGETGGLLGSGGSSSGGSLGGGVSTGGLVAHYRADDYTAGNWPDRTGNGFDLSQSTGANQPTAVANGGLEFGGQPVVRFDGSDDFLERASTPSLPQPHTKVIIAKTVADSSNSKFVVGSIDDSARGDIFFNSNEQVQTYAGSGLTGTDSHLNQVVLAEALFDGSSSAIRVNGAVESIGDAGSQTSIGLRVGLPSYDLVSQAFDGDIAEILIYDGELTSTQRQELADYAATRYGVGQTDLVAHYRADDYTAGSWPDRTGNGFDLSQSTGANQPTAVSDGGFEFGNQPVVRFDGSNDFMQNTDIALSQPSTVVVIGKAATVGAAQFYTDGGTNLGARQSVYYDNPPNETASIYAGSSDVRGSGGPGTVELLEGYFDGANSSIRRNGTVLTSGNAGSQSLGGLTVGARYDGTQWFLDGDVAEILIYDGPLSESERQDLADYAATRYGVGQTDLVAHYRADDYTAGNWPDRTGNGFNLSQGTAANQPTAVADGGFEFGGQPVVRFDGSNDFMQNIGLTLPQPHTAVIIAKTTQNTGTNQYPLFSKSGGPHSWIGFNSSEALFTYAGTTLNSGSGSMLNSTDLIEAFYNGSNSSIRRNGTLLITGNAGTQSRGDIIVGAQSTGANYWGGDLAEILIYDGELTSTQRQELADYAATRYGVGQTDLVAHYRADDYTAGNWPDRTGNGFDLTQSTSANQPTLVVNVSEGTLLDSFESWPSGTGFNDPPEGWTALGAGSLQQTTGGVTHGSFAVSLGGSGKIIEKNFDLTDVGVLLLDFSAGGSQGTTVRVGGDSGSLNGTVVFSEASPSGTRSINVSAYTGTQLLSIEHSAVSPSSLIVDNIRTGTLSGGDPTFGNQPVVNFDGSNDFLSHATTPSLAAPYTIVAIAQSNLTGTSNYMVADNAANSPVLYFDSSDNITLAASTALSGGNIGIGTHLLEGLVNGSDSAVYVDSALAASGNAGTGVMDGIRVGIRYDAVAASAFDGRIAEIRIYDGELSSTQRQELADYAEDRYGIGRTDLIAWYRADDYTAGNWPDKNGSNLTLSQGTAGNQPTTVADGGFEFGGQPVVRFDGVNDFLKDTSLTLSQPLTYVVIQKLTLDNSTTKTIVDGTTASNRAALAFLSNEAPVIYGGAQLDGSGSLHNVSTLIEAFYDGTSSSLRVDGELNVSGNAGTLTSAGLTVGTYYDTDANWYAGDIADILIYDGPLSADERQDLLDYAAERYGVNQILLLAGDTGNEVAAFTKSGDILLAGTLTQNGTPAATSDDELVFKDGNGDTVALLNTVTGDMLIAGSLFANQQTLAPSSASDDFVMQDDDGTVVIYFDDSGNLYLKGDVEENASF